MRASTLGAFVGDLALVAAQHAPAAPANEAPQHFVSRVFAIYATNSKWWALTTSKSGSAYQKKVYAYFYDPTFVKLMNDNDTLAAAKGGGEDLDYDPVCQCQDSGGAYRYLSGHARGLFFDAKVTDNGQGQKPWTLVLAKTPAGWRIWDVVDTTGSLRTWLGKHNACLRAAKTEKQGEACIS